jgi:YbbR domain-containing protein
LNLTPRLSERGRFPKVSYNQQPAMTDPIHQSIFSRRYVKYIIPCFFIGICVFLLLSNTASDEVDVFIPVDYIQIPAGLTMTQPAVNGIEARISGPKSKISALTSMKLRYALDLSKVYTGYSSIPINPDQIGLPSGFSVVGINPKQIAVRIEKEIEKKLPVKVSLSGNPVAGYMVANTIARPLLVTISGPETTIIPMEEIPTKPINIKGLSESFKKEIALDLPEEVQIVGSSNIISAEVLIEEKITVKKINHIPVKGSDTPYIYNITPTTIDIEVKGPTNIVDKLDKDNHINVYVDLQGLTPGVYIRRATITLPVKTTLVGVTPEIFTIKIINQKK